MAFENEKVTQEERKNFQLKGIKNPLSPTLPTLKPTYWTIDKEKNVYLFRIGTHRDYPNEELFFYKWKDQEFILPIKKENRLPDTRIWSLNTSWDSPLKHIENSELWNELIKDLRLALKEHKLYGNLDDTNEVINIVCDF